MHSQAPAPQPSTTTRQVAVVDCGTSSVRAFIAQLQSDGGDPEILEDLSFPVDLTDAFVSGKLSRQAMDGVVEAFVNIARRIPRRRGRQSRRSDRRRGRLAD